MLITHGKCNCHAQRLLVKETHLHLECTLPLNEAQTNSHLWPVQRPEKKRTAYETIKTKQNKNVAFGKLIAYYLTQYEVIFFFFKKATDDHF